MTLPDEFDTFYDKISLGKTPSERIESATNGLMNYLTTAYDLAHGGVFLQGSYPNGTAVEPADHENGEYDADLVCVCATPTMSADAALDDLTDTLAAHGTYAELLKKDGARKKPCVRLRYADSEVGGFHVDVVPARPSQVENPNVPLEVPRRGEGWHDSAPAEYTRWCEEQGLRFARTVKMLKRWREEHQPARHNIKSIVLQVLASTNLATQSSDAEALVATLSAIKRVLDSSPTSPPIVENPVLPDENLSARWTDAAYANFRKELGEAVALADRALASQDRTEKHQLWRKLLGEDFPPAPSDPARRTRIPPTTPAPGHHETPVIPPRERYGR